MTPNTKALLLIVVLLASLQWLIVPIFGWQNERVAVIEDDLSTLASREALVGGILSWSETQLFSKRLWFHLLTSRLSRAQLRRLRCSDGLLHRSRTGS